MRYIINEKTNPKYNLALEEYVLKNLDGEFFSYGRMNLQ